MFDRFTSKLDKGDEMIDRVFGIVEKLHYSGVKENSKRNKFGYKKEYCDSSIELYKRGRLNKRILSTCEGWAILQNPVKNDVLYLYPNINSAWKKTIVFSQKTFPGLIEGSKIMQCMLLPYMREVDEGIYVKSMRLNIITDKCQVYHNFPSRGKEYESKSLFNDEIRFEESAVWDLPGHLYPCKEHACSDVERFYPYLPDSAYEYHPVLNTDSSFQDIYRNGGFGKEETVISHGTKKKVSRFYFPKRTAASNSFFHIGGEEPNYKMTVIGTYRSNNNGNGVRTVVFATSDGGRNWFAKYEFGDVGEYQFTQGKDDWRTAFGNVIKLPDYNGEGSIKLDIRKRNVIVPTEECKEPEKSFMWDDAVVISSICNQDTTVIKTHTKHKLDTGNIITIISNDEKECFYSNNSVSEVSGGNGILYKVQVIDDYSFKIYEFVASAHNAICCRHIHQINRIKDGWLIGTGEIYPNGWLLYMQMREADTYCKKSASDELPIWRLNSSEKSVQRTLGAIMLDDDDNTLIFASDHDLLSRQKICVPCDRSIETYRSSVGVFKGKIKDVDDRSKFSIIYEAQEPSFLFKRIGEILVFAGQRGEFAISNNLGKNWKSYRLETTAPHLYRGYNRWYFVIDDYIIAIRQ